MIALQEVATPEISIPKIKKELEGEWKDFYVDSGDDKDKGNKHHLVFLWKNETIELGKTRGGLVKASKHHLRKFLCKTFVAYDVFNFQLLNFHIRPWQEDTHKLEIDHLHEAYYKVKTKEYSTILIGDFNEYPCNDHLMKEEMYENIFRPHESTNTLHTKVYDNIIVPYRLYLCCDNHWVVKSDKAKMCSDHYPIVAQFSVPSCK